MKNIYFGLLLLCGTLCAQDYHRNWKKVLELESQGKIKSADEVVEKIFRKAERNDNGPQLVKCFFYRSKYALTLDANASHKILDRLRAQTQTAKNPNRSLFLLIYAKSLSDFYRANYYRFDNTVTDSLPNDNSQLWSRKNFEEEIARAYSESLTDSIRLKKTKALAYEQIFDYLSKQEFASKTLFDFVISENIEYRCRKWKEHTNQASVWQNDNTRTLLMANAATFVDAEFDTVSDIETKRILKLFQHREKADPSISNRLDRILSLLPETSRVEALLQLRAPSHDTIANNNIRYELASTYRNLASEGPNKNYLINAVALLDSIIQTKKRSNSYLNAIQTRKFILEKDMSASFERVAYTGQNVRALVSFRNVDTLTLKIYRAEAKVQLLKHHVYSTDLEALVTIGKLEPEMIKTYALANPGDYFSHSTEILMPHLAVGTYIIEFGANGLPRGKNAYSVMTVSDIALLTLHNTHEIVYTAVNRKTGTPLSGAGVNLLSKNEVRKTDQSGTFRIASSGFREQFQGYVFSGNDSIAFYHEEYGYSHEPSKATAKSELFLDRAIYRPGQTVYFKGIVVRRDSIKANVVPKIRFRIMAKDPNFETVFEKIVETNEFGSFSGEFQLPKEGMTGSFRLMATEPPQDDTLIFTDLESDFYRNTDYDNPNLTFVVEEYKRPKFQVAFEKAKGSLTLEKEAEIYGSAKALSGSNLSGAKVKYSVSLSHISYKTDAVNFTRRWPETDQIDEIVASDSSETDENGRFRIKFFAERHEDEDVDKRDKFPVYHYSIKADVTDLNGETRSAETFVKIAKHTLELDFSGSVSKSRDNKIKLLSNDLNGEFKAVSGEIRLRRVKRAVDKFKRREHRIPDIPGFSSEEWKRLFPNELDEDDLTIGLDSSVVKTIPVNTGQETEISIDLSDVAPGDYEAVFSARDELGNVIEHRAIWPLADPDAKFDASKLLSLKVLNAHPEKDRFVLVRVSSPVKNLHLRLLANFKSDVFFDKSIALENHVAVVRIPIKKEFTLGIALSADAFYDNSFASERSTVMLPEPVSELELETVSHRNLIEPGSKQTWAFRIKAKNTALASEILASMYDSSLDAFATSRWDSPGMENSYHPYGQTRYVDETKESIYLNSFRYVAPPTLRPENTKLIWFGFDINNRKSQSMEKLYKDQVTRKALKPTDSRTIRGYVSDGTGVLPGALVTVRGTQRSVQTDVDGYYEIEVAEGEILDFSFVGMTNQTVVVSFEQQFDVLLEEGQTALGEVVVTAALGIQKRKESSASTEYILRRGEEDNSVMGLVGKVSGIQVNTAANGKSPTTITLRGNRSATASDAALIVVDGKIISMKEFQAMSPANIAAINVIKGAQGAALYGQMGGNGVIVVTTQQALSAMAEVKARTNFSETAFFYPHLLTDAKGGFRFSFTSPDALTSWKMRLLAHNKEGISTQIQHKIATQKTLMVTPNLPRFLRENDSIVISVKISSLASKQLTGSAILELSDAATMQNVDSRCANISKIKTFSLGPMGNESVNWKIHVPQGLSGLHYRIVAQADGFSDGEENILPVLTNSMLVTESKPIWLLAHSEKTLEFQNLKNSASKTLRHHKMTLEFTSNPAWIALQSLPYLMEYEHECSEQLFARFYANAIATSVIESNPKIADVIRSWGKEGKARFEQNEELKSALANETPWFEDAQSESERKQRLATLLDLDKMRVSQRSVFEKLKQKQYSSGGFPWFAGSQADAYITRHIVSGLGHLKQLGIAKRNESDIMEIAAKAVAYMDEEFVKWHAKSDHKHRWFQNSYSDLHYLYARSFFLRELPLKNNVSVEVTKGLQAIATERFKLSLYEKAMAALVLHRFGKSNEALELIDHLAETSARDESIGMHWVENRDSWFWYQAPIETQALLIEAFAEISNDRKSVDAMKAWLIKSKQTSNWSTTKATTEAVYALLMQGSDWLDVKDNIVFEIGDEKVRSKKLSETKKEAETGYVKINWKADEINRDMATLQIENKTDVPAFGGFYWQYFDELDAIKKSESGPMSVNKELFRKIDAAGGTELRKIATGSLLKIGETLTMRIVLNVAEDLEYVHLKSMRGSCFEPVDVLSGYESNGNVWFYKSTNDLATHYFFDRLRSGSYILEYEVRVNNAGDFSNGITTIQSMYAPEFSAHSKGIRVKVTAK